VLLAKPYDGKALSQALAEVGIDPISVKIRTPKSSSSD
jgi:hypothetical protein